MRLMRGITSQHLRKLAAQEFVKGNISSIHPAVKVLLDCISSDEEIIFKDCPGGIVLVEKSGPAARKILKVTSEMLRQRGDNITLDWVDMKADYGCDDYEHRIQKRLLDQSSSLRKIYIIENFTEYLGDIELERQLKALHEAITFREVCCIFLLEEKSLRAFSEKFDWRNRMKQIWIHRQPFTTLQSPPSRYDNSSFYTEEAWAIMEKTRELNAMRGREEVGAEDLFEALVDDREIAEALAAHLEIQPENFQHFSLFPAKESICSNRSKGIIFNAEGKQILRDAMSLASANGCPNSTHPGLIDNYHLAGAACMNESLMCRWLPIFSLSFAEAKEKIASWYDSKMRHGSISGNKINFLISGHIKALRRNLLGEIFGQKRAVNAFVDELSSAELMKNLGRKQNDPGAVFLFAGPEGTGKKYLAEVCAQKLHRPRIKFDLAAYSSSHGHHELAGVPGKHSGLITDFVLKNPSAVLIFQNVEQAHFNTLQVLCRILDTGKLFDRYTGEEVSFKRTIIVFTTDRELPPGSHSEKEVYADCDERAAMIRHLKNSPEPGTGLPVFPEALAKRLNENRLVLFDHLQPGDIHLVAAKKLEQHAIMLEQSSHKKITFDPLLPITFVYRQGGEADLRALGPAIEKHLNKEIMNFVIGSGSFSEEILRQFQRIHFALENRENMNQEVENLYFTDKPPKILLFAGQSIAEKIVEEVTAAEWFPVSSPSEMKNVIANQEIDFAILDMWMDLHQTEGHIYSKHNLVKSFTWRRDAGTTVLPLELIMQNMPVNRHLEVLHDLAPRLPVFMLNLSDDIGEQHLPFANYNPAVFYRETAAEFQKIEAKTTDILIPPQAHFRYDYFLEYLSVSGARGFINAEFSDDDDNKEAQWRSQFNTCVSDIFQVIHRERKAHELRKNCRFLSFTPAWEINEKDRLVTVKLKNMQLI